MGLHLSHWFVREDADVDALQGLVILEDIAKAGEHAGEKATVYIGQTESLRLSSGWTAIFPRIDLDMPGGVTHADIGMGVITSRSRDTDAGKVSEIVSPLVEVWWSSVVDSGIVRVWENGVLTEESKDGAHEAVQFDALLSRVMGYANADELADDFTRAQGRIARIPTQTYYTLEYHELDAFIREEFNNPTYEIVAEEEWLNDSVHTCTVDLSWYSTYDKERVHAFIESSKPAHWASLMRELALRGVIPEGKYLITVSW